MLYSLLTFGAEAHDLEIHVTVPGSDPVWTTILDIRPGTKQTLTFPGSRRTVYRLQTTVEEPSTDGYEWRVTFELAAGVGKGTWPNVLMRPTMVAHTNELAQVTQGSTQPLADSEAPAVIFHGYEIEWIVRNEASP